MRNMLLVTLVALVGMAGCAGTKRGVVLNDNPLSITAVRYRNTEGGIIKVCRTGASQMAMDARNENWCPSITMGVKGLETPEHPGGWMAHGNLTEDNIIVAPPWMGLIETATKYRLFLDAAQKPDMQVMVTEGGQEYACDIMSLAEKCSPNIRVALVTRIYPQDGTVIVPHDVVDIEIPSHVEGPVVVTVKTGKGGHNVKYFHYPPLKDVPVAMR